MRIYKAGETTVDHDLFGSDEEINARLNEIALIMADVNKKIADSTGVAPEEVVLAGIKMIFVANKGVGGDHGGMCSKMAIAVNRIGRPRYQELLNKLEDEGLIP